MRDRIRSSGMTIVSVVVAAALTGIVALAIGRLIGNQADAMAVIKLREQREELLKHYKNIVVSGWDSTRGGSCSGVICNRSGTPVIPTANGSALYLADDLYDYGYGSGTAARWWKVSATESSLSGGSVLQADSYAKPDPLVAVTVKVEFIRKEHPTVDTVLSDREEIVFLHHRTRTAVGSNDTDCADGNHLTQVNRSGSALYSGTGAIVQYDFNSNYTKCSQVPLVNSQDCGSAGAVVGFFRKTGTAAQLITGNPICSTTHAGSTLAAIRRESAKRTVKSIDCSGSGYVMQIGLNEEPVCVPVSGGQPQRVAAESDGGEKETKAFTVLRRSTPGGDGVRATYTNATCSVERDKAIDSFNADGTVNYLAYHNYHAQPQAGVNLIGWRGPRGEPGANSTSDSLRGEPGTCGYKYCCRYRTCRYSYTVWCDSDGDGRRDDRCTRSYTYRCRRRC